MKIKEVGASMVVVYALTTTGSLYAGMPSGRLTEIGLANLSNTKATVGEPGYTGTISISGFLPGMNVATILPPGLDYRVAGNTMTITGTPPTKSGDLKFTVSLSVPGISWATFSHKRSEGATSGH
jgi:hypothetical protein